MYLRWPALPLAPVGPTETHHSSFRVSHQGNLEPTEVGQLPIGTGGTAMLKLNRRKFVIGFGCGVALPWAWQVRAAPLIERCNVASERGQEMLIKFAAAVKRMQDIDISQSSSWRYQWYVHAVPERIDNAPVTKETELNRAFGSSSSAERTLAEDVWQTCQAHRPGTDSRMFLGWHRLYLLAFEDIIRGVLSDEDFALPYWDYTKDARIPEAFRSPTGDTASLYRANRTRTKTLDINAGDPMDKGTTVSPFNLDDMKHEDFAVFSRMIDGNLHGNVHVGVGDASNMGRVPTAAGDPIFWLHHCNIDRIWAGWNAAGGKTVTTSKEFVFADRHNNRWARDVASVSSLVGLYDYDALPRIPGERLTSSASGKGQPEILAASTSGPTELTAQPTRIALSPRADTSLSVAARATPNRSIVVLMSGVNSASQPGTLYEVFLDLPSGADRGTYRDHYIGTFSFFNTGKGEQSFEFEATAVIERLGARGMLAKDSAITIIPVHSPDQAARPVVGIIRIEQR